jgi:hypothetical protein
MKNAVKDDILTSESPSGLAMSRLLTAPAFLVVSHDLGRAKFCIVELKYKFLLILRMAPLLSVHHVCRGPLRTSLHGSTFLRHLLI